METFFPNYKSMKVSVAMEKHSFDPVCPKTLCSLSTIPVMLHKKFDQDWPQLVSEIFKFESVDDD